jgi:hypothetical protein
MLKEGFDYCVTVAGEIEFGSSIILGSAIQKEGVKKRAKSAAPKRRLDASVIILLNSFIFITYNLHTALGAVSQCNLPSCFL